MKTPAARAVLLLIEETTLGPDRQMRACMAYADQHHLEVAALTTSQHGAVGTVTAGLVSVLLCAVEPLGGGLPQWVYTQVEKCGGRLLVVRRNAPRARAADDAEKALIRAALTNSDGDVDLVARLLGLPADRVRAMAAADDARAPQAKAGIRHVCAELPSPGSHPRRPRRLIAEGQVPLP